MRALKLNFVRKPGPLRGLGIVLLLAAVATAAYVGQLYVERATALETWEAKWQSVQKAQRKGPAEAHSGQKLEREQLQADFKLASRIIGRLAMPWDALFREVEATVDEKVSLLGIEPDTEKNTVRISAEAKNLVAMLGYQKRLSSIAFFKDVHVISHQSQPQDPQKPVRFIVAAQWVELLQPATDVRKAAQSIQDQTGQ